MSAKKKKNKADQGGSPGVKIRLGPGKNAAAGGLWNISLGGVFIEMREPLAFGSEMELEFTLPTDPRTIRCRGFVVWSTKDTPEKARGMKGIGVRLTDIGISEMRHLSTAVERRLD